MEQGARTEVMERPWGHLGPPGATNLLVLQLADGGLGPLEVLGGRGAALLHHRQLPLDDVVLLGLLRPRHLALGTAGTRHWVRQGVAR